MYTRNDRRYVAQAYERGKRIGFLSFLPRWNGISAAFCAAFFVWTERERKAVNNHMKYSKDNENEYDLNE